MMFAIKKIAQMLFSNSWRQWIKSLVIRTFRKSGQLNYLALIYNSDKFGIHFYTPHYSEIFWPIRKNKNVLLEIGIGGYGIEKSGGSSLRMWKDFFYKSNIYGIDIEPKNFVDQKRIKTFQGSQIDFGFLDNVIKEIGKPNIIIDDGSHVPSDIIETFKFLFPKLQNKGFYAIEDTQTSYWPSWGGSLDLNNELTTINFFKKLVDGLNHEEIITESYTPDYFSKNIVEIRFYHNLIIVFKGENCEGSNMVFEKRLKSR
jgi:hypothetical protein